MLRHPFLRNVLMISLALMLVLPLYDIFYIFPAYRQLLMAETEDEAVRFVNYLVRTLDLQGQTLGETTLPETVREETALLQEDALLVKLRIFSPKGRILYSTVAGEVGQVNNSGYFHQVVARGQIYSRVVNRDQTSAEGLSINRDVVETYVPVMIPGGFGGAMEVYYDITGSVQGIDELNRHSSITLGLLCGSLLLLLLLTMRRAGQNLEARHRAEQQLRSSNEQLEVRVAERTRQLSAEVAEKTLAQSALKSALAEADAARTRIDGILRSVNDPLIAIGPQQQILLLNNAALQLLEVPAAAVVGRPFGEVAPLQRLGEPIGSALRRETVAAFDLRFDTQAGKMRVYQGSLSPITSLDGGFDGVILVLREVTRERELERMKSEFLAMAAHELHTPITTIMGYTELLGGSQEQFSDAQKREFLGYIHAKAEALALLVDDLLDVSRMEAGQPLALHLDRFPLGPELEKLLEAARSGFKGREIVLHPVAAELQLSFDRSRFRQLLGNLLGNAVKYSPGSAPVEIRATATAGGVLLCVADHGIGMSGDEVRHAFERFYRADTSTTAVSGTGLGLSIVRYIVEAHRGKVWIESDPGLGTRVFCLLPGPAPEH